MQDNISEKELEYVFDLKASNGRALGPAPLRRKRFGFHTPSERYEAILNRLIQPGDEWLDLGGGRRIFPHNPILAREITQRCSRVVGIDPSTNIHENPFVSERFQGFLGITPEKETLTVFRCKWSQNTSPIQHLWSQKSANHLSLVDMSSFSPFGITHPSPWFHG